MSKKRDADAKPVDAVAEKPRKSSPGSEKESSGGIVSRLNEFKEYLVLSRAELRKVSWATWKETRTTSIVVLVFVAIMALLLGLVDLGLAGLIRLVLS